MNSHNFIKINCIPLIVSIIFLFQASPAIAQISWQWDFGDGTTSSSGQNLAHSYSAAGNYSWKLTVSVNGRECVQTGQITVTDPCIAPTITEQPQPQAVLPGKKATIGVTATGTNLNYQWYEGPLGSTKTKVGMNSPFFSTPALKKARQYWAMVSNGCGTQNSVAVKIDVNPLAPSIRSISSKTSAPGAAATIRGRNFSTDKRSIKVLFGSLRASIKTSAANQLGVIIPKKAQAGSVLVVVQVGKLKSNPLRFAIRAAAERGTS